MPDPRNRWLAETGGRRGPQYARRFRELAASGADIHGEARAIDTLVRSALTKASADGAATVLDAGCGTGRVALELARRGHQVTGVDLDESMLVEARAEAAQERLTVDFVSGDLLDLASLVSQRFDVVAAPGNVLVYLTPGTEAQVVASLASVVRPGGLVVVGFALDRHVSAADYEGWCRDAGLRVEHRWATWDGEPLAGGDYAVFVHRR